MHMKLRTIVILLCILPALPAHAQQKQFGYLDYRSTITDMPEYAEAENSLKKMQEDFRKENERSENDFHRQYIEYLHTQKQLSETILRKRQKELQLLYDSNIEFNRMAKEALQTERKRLMKPIEDKLKNAIRNVGRELGLDYIIDSDGGSYLYIDTLKSIDITGFVKERLANEENSKQN